MVSKLANIPEWMAHPASVGFVSCATTIMSRLGDEQQLLVGLTSGWILVQAHSRWRSRNSANAAGNSVGKEEHEGCEKYPVIITASSLCQYIIVQYYKYMVMFGYTSLRCIKSLHKENKEPYTTDSLINLPMLRRYNIFTQRIGELIKKSIFHAIQASSFNSP